MKELFVSMPDSLSMVMTQVNRADCVDFIASKMEAKVTNRFDRPSIVTHLTDDYARVQVSAQSTWEMRRLPLKDTVNVICMVTTVSGPVKDSHIRFYDTRWNELESSRFLSGRPVADDFFPVPDEARRGSLQDLRRKADVTFMQASLSEEAPVLSFTYTTPDYLNKEDGDKLKAYMRKTPIVYEWRDKRFVAKQEVPE